MKGAHKEYIRALSCPDATVLVHALRWGVEHRALINGHETVVFR